jgi:hypothetical protein
MKNPNIQFHSISFLLLSILFLGSCNTSQKDCKNEFIEKRERIEYYTAAEMRAEPSFLGPQVLKEAGKVFWMGDYIYLSDGQNGIHIIDNTKASKLEPIAFIKIEGNWDIAAKGQYLYADSYADLLIFDLSNPAQPKLANRVNDVFDWDEVISRLRMKGLEERLVKDRYFEEVKFSIPCGADMAVTNTGANSGSGEGQGGSLARFSISGEYLYAVDNRNLHVFNLRLPDTPVKAGGKLVDEKIETIFSYGDRLFIGGMMGVYIYDKTDPLNPQYLDQFKHIESCDPVYVDQDYAYVTLREDANCRNADNKLLVLDVKDFTKAELIAEFPMTHPHGLGVKDNRLYLAEGKHGFKVFDLKDKKAIDQHLIAADSSIWVQDLIPHPYYDLLLLVGDDGLFQYDIKNPAAPRRLQELRTFE